MKGTPPTKITLNKLMLTISHLTTMEEYSRLRQLAMIINNSNTLSSGLSITNSRMLTLLINHTHSSSQQISRLKQILRMQLRIPLNSIWQCNQEKVVAKINKLLSMATMTINSIISSRLLTTNNITRMILMLLPTTNNTMVEEVLGKCRLQCSSLLKTSSSNKRQRNQNNEAKVSDHSCCVILVED